ncbi:MAG: hypothetical protein QXO69_02405 [archaeon]
MDNGSRKSKDSANRSSQKGARELAELEKIEKEICSLLKESGLKAKKAKKAPTE